MLRFAVISLFSFFVLLLYPQNTPTILSSLNQHQAGKGVVKVNHNQSIDDILNKHIELNKKNNTIQGFRIRIYSDAGTDARRKWDETAFKFNKIYSEIGIYREYKAPYFKLYAGDLRTKSEALKLYKLIKKDFPKAFIVSSKINPPKL